MFGIRVEGQLVAQMVAMGTLRLEQAVERNAITRNEITFHHAEMTDLAVIAKSMAVHPNWRGNELSQHILAAMLAMPSVRAANHVFAQISVENARSWELFCNGFGIVGASIDPVDLKPRFIVQKSALGFPYYPAASLENIDPVTDFDAITKLTEREALIGQLDELDASKLSFFASGDTAAAWTEEPVRLVR